MKQWWIYMFAFKFIKNTQIDKLGLGTFDTKLTK